MPNQEDKTHCCELLQRAGGFACDLVLGVASGNVVVRSVATWRAALLDQPFRRDSTPTLRALEAEGTPTRSARKALAAEVAVAAAVCSTLSRADGEGENNTSAASSLCELLLWLTMHEELLG